MNHAENNVVLNFGIRNAITYLKQNPELVDKKVNINSFVATHEIEFANLSDLDEIRKHIFLTQKIEEIDFYNLSVL